jgi:hypothetical protein
VKYLPNGFIIGDDAHRNEKCILALDQTPFLSLIYIPLLLLSYRCAGIKGMSAAAWTEFGRALDAGAFKLRTLELSDRYRTCLWIRVEFRAYRGVILLFFVM